MKFAKDAQTLVEGGSIRRARAQSRKILGKQELEESEKALVSIF